MYRHIPVSKRQKTLQNSIVYRILKRTDKLFCLSLSILYMVLQLICLSFFLSFMLNKIHKFDTTCTSILIEFVFKIIKMGMY